MHYYCSGVIEVSVKVAVLDLEGRILKSPSDVLQSGRTMDEIFPGFVSANVLDSVNYQTKVWKDPGYPVDISFYLVPTKQCWLAIINEGLSSGLASPADPNVIVKAVLEASCDEIWITDAKGTILFINGICEEHYGVSADKLVGCHYGDLVEDGLFYPSILPAVLKEKKRVTIEQHTVTGCKNTVTATPIMDEQGRITFIVGNVRNITSLELNFRTRKVPLNPW